MYPGSCEEYENSTDSPLISPILYPTPVPVDLSLPIHYTKEVDGYNMSCESKKEYISNDEKYYVFECDNITFTDSSSGTVYKQII